MAAGLRICHWSGLPKAAEEFHLRNRAKEDVTRVAASFNAYRHEHYRLNREAYIQRNNGVLRDRRRKWAERLCEYLFVHPCVDCGEADPVVLELDHVDRGTKLQAVSFLARRGYPWTTVESESRSARSAARTATAVERPSNSTGPKFTEPRCPRSPVLV